MAANPLACATCPVRDRAACSALTEDQRSELTQLGQHRTLRRGETLFATGDEGFACATLISGALKIASFSADGTERILSLVHPAGFVGEMFAPVERHDVVALTDSNLCVFARKDYERAIERFPALGRALLRRTAQDLFESRSAIDLMSRRSAQQKVAGFILSIARSASESPCHAAAQFDLPLSRAEIAGVLGLTIETVSRQLSRLEREGVIARQGRRGVRLVDAVRLEQLAA
ncbi:Crp/Fnr family transcriptional regulator [Sphingomonas sinipercae]|uniref:Crp/Fnr family transcriptional regulator n=1 Tax=Sphingomonas sinipercae TaxID=2714944 RepID=A0A6G7ZKZ9_9SPHN|nr:Crp/Fnr family transcriptional regulator [Sphingomonas sinipercae]QIL01613.1 Crp/Fnr family transcriptional regulator [Sphingomonas sinipercae]